MSPIELPQNREQRRRALREERRETRDQLVRAIGRDKANAAIIPDHIFPTTVRREAAKFSAQLRRARHEIHFIEHDAGMIEVVCSDECGFVAPAPFGLGQAERIKETHYAMFHIIHDPTGAKYRA